ncbi:MAG: DUF3987 domain-containing protein [Bacteroidales bacterium]|nr:DUF3987 domain-containing protein [Bacteroidales bacterium]
MTKKKFNPQEWLNNTATTKDEILSPSKEISEGQRGNDDIEEIVSRIESKNIDITAAYADWRDIGFAFSSELGEGGRQYFHRISRFYSDYSPAECDKQYDKCLKSKGSGITIKTFFQKAKEAGINLATSSISTPDLREVSADGGWSGDEDKLPVFSSEIYNLLPQFLQEICNVTSSPDEKDLLLSGSMAVLSSCIPNVYGYYHDRKVNANLYLFVTAPASAGKGILTHCTRLVYPIHKQLREESQVLKSEYEREYNEYLIIRKKNPAAEKPQKPPEKMLFIPANNSASGVFQLLHDNDGKGLIFETEGDTMAFAFKSDYGNYSDGFRKAFHHETIRYYRKTDREFVDIECPRLSAVLSGTPKQVQNLIPEVENGLFSRFIFYYLEMSSVWKDVFERRAETGLDEYFDRFAQQYFELYKILKSAMNIEFTLTASQQQQFNSTFARWQNVYETLIGQEYVATVRRLGLITFRFAMIFSVLRILETGDLPKRIICEERDFQNAISITEVLIVHAKKVFSDLPQPVPILKRENREERFFSQLPDKFSRKDYVELASRISIPDKTAQNYISKMLKKGLIHRDKHDCYLKISNEDIKDSGDI